MVLGSYEAFERPIEERSSLRPPDRAIQVMLSVQRVDTATKLVPRCPGEETDQ